MAATSARLLAVALPPAAAGPVMQALWARGDALLPLDPHAPAPARQQILEAVRPDAVVEASADVERLLAAGGGEQTDAPAHDANSLAAALWDASRALPEALPTAAGTALVVATSGSTGEPKGVVLDHAALRYSVQAGLNRLGAQPGDRWGLALPTHHVAGLTVWLRALALGTHPLLLDAEAARDPMACLRAGIRFVSLVPTQLSRWVGWWLEHHGDRSPEELFGSEAAWPTVLLGGGPAAPDLLPTATHLGIEVVTSYGMTETCGGCVYDGRPLDGVEIRVDGGLVAIRGPVLATGYRPHPLLEAPGERGGPAGLVDAEGWFTTSDLGRIVDAGRVEILGRADDVVVSGGENVPLDRVREILLAHPRVADVAVTGRPDDRWGTVVVAVVATTNDDEPSPSDDERSSGRDERDGDRQLLSELRETAARHLPRSWGPRELVRVEAVPRDDMGKLSRARLEALLTDPAARRTRLEPSDRAPG